MDKGILFIVALAAVVVAALGAAYLLSPGIFSAIPLPASNNAQILVITYNALNSSQIIADSNVTFSNYNQQGTIQCCDYPAIDPSVSWSEIDAPTASGKMVLNQKYVPVTEVNRYVDGVIFFFPAGLASLPTTFQASAPGYNTEAYSINLDTVGTSGDHTGLIITIPLVPGTQSTTTTTIWATSTTLPTSSTITSTSTIPQQTTTIGQQQAPPPTPSPAPGFSFSALLSIALSFISNALKSLGFSFVGTQAVSAQLNAPIMQQVTIPLSPANISAPWASGASSVSSTLCVSYVIQNSTASYVYQSQPQNATSSPFTAQVSYTPASAGYYTVGAACQTSYRNYTNGAWQPWTARQPSGISEYLYNVQPPATTAPSTQPTTSIPSPGGGSAPGFNFGQLWQGFLNWLSSIGI